MKRECWIGNGISIADTSEFRPVIFHFLTGKEDFDMEEFSMLMALQPEFTDDNGSVKLLYLPYEDILFILSDASKVHGDDGFVDFAVSCDDVTTLNHVLSEIGYVNHPEPQFTFVTIYVD